MSVLVQCVVCNKNQFVPASRAAKYKTCSIECMGKMFSQDRAEQKVEKICPSCEKLFYLKKSSQNRRVYCSKKCQVTAYQKRYLGRNNPNCKYENLRDEFFAKVDTEEKAYLLGWIASDGCVANSNGATQIQINVRDKAILKRLRDVICPALPIKYRRNDMLSLSISSQEIQTDICLLLDIAPAKKSYVVNFPQLDSEELTWAFIRGFFDGDGSIARVDSRRSPKCSITTNSRRMRDGIKKFCGINCYENNNSGTLEWYNGKALEFLSKLYERASIFLPRKYTLYMDWVCWVPSLSGAGNHGRIENFRWIKTRKAAFIPLKEGDSDIFSLTLIEKIKHAGELEIYDTGIKIQPAAGWYFDIVPQSSLLETGYMVAGNFEPVDRRYVSSVLVPLIKIEKNAPDLKLPARIVKILPKPIVHLEILEVDDFE